jgi:chloramphenicol-sensitive protein RarD
MVVRRQALAAALATPAGPITTIPLLMFAAGGRRIPLSTLGLLQNVTSMLQQLIGICIYGEPFGPVRRIRPVT